MTHILGNLTFLMTIFMKFPRQKKSIKLNLPMQIGFSFISTRNYICFHSITTLWINFLTVQILNTVKWTQTRHMLHFLVTTSKPLLYRSELKEEYEREKFNWFPRDYNGEVKAFDKRTPGLFKNEFLGDGIIGLNSKMYFCFNDSKAKFSCKGVNKYTNAITKDTYLNVIQTKTTGHATNRGFRVRENKVCNYTQAKNAFTYFYGKRKVLADGVSTTYLDI